MKGQDFYTKANRSSIVVKTRIDELRDGDIRSPRIDFLDHPSDAHIRQAVLNGDTIWRLTVSHRTGFDKLQSFREIYLSEERAKEAEAQYQIGSSYDPWDFLQATTQDFDPNELSILTELSVLGRGEPPYELINEVLVGAAVCEDWGPLSQPVLQWLGQAGINALKVRFGENWETVASLEYCMKHFHPSSLASLAARVQVADFIAQDNYEAGYAARELELLYGGVEDIALRSVQTSKIAGKGGGEASRKRRLANLEVLIEEIEKLSGAVGLISENRIVEQAFEAAKNRESNMPKSRKTLEDYGTALRSEEPFKSRYEAVFRKNA